MDGQKAVVSSADRFDLHRIMIMIFKDRSQLHVAGMTKAATRNFTASTFSLFFQRLV